MSAIECIHLTAGELELLESAAVIDVDVSGVDLRIARSLTAKGLGGTYSQRPNLHTFTINQAGRDQLALRQ